MHPLTPAPEDKDNFYDWFQQLEQRTETLFIPRVQFRLQGQWVEISPGTKRHNLPEFSGGCSWWERRRPYKNKYTSGWVYEWTRQISVLHANSVLRLCADACMYTASLQSSTDLTVEATSFLPASRKRKKPDLSFKFVHPLLNVRLK